jgi:3,4-dihydroxy 2-butanone 4-phosphate synthase/GTP cyclohydrolase II
MTHSFVCVQRAIDELKAGRMIILVDDEHRENEGDLVLAAEYATPEAINFMSRFARGLICLPMHERLIDKLGLSMMATKNHSPFNTAFTISIEAAQGVSTGISAHDRAHTIRVAIDEKSDRTDVISPGHVFPLRAKPGGVLERQGQTEGSVDLMTLAGLRPAAVICEIMNDDGSMSRREELEHFALQHNMPLISIRDLMHYRIHQEILVEAVASSRLPLQAHGDFTMTVFRNQLDDAEHFTLVKPMHSSDDIPLVRIHSECITGDLFGSAKCDCGDQLNHSLAMIAKEGGVLIYLRQEGRGIGLANKLKAYALQEQGFDTVEANEQLGLPVDNRDYGVAFQILKWMGIEHVRLLTNNPEKMASLQSYGIHVHERVALESLCTKENRDYLHVKQTKMGHFLTVESESIA